VAHIVTVRDWTPRIHPDAFVAPTAVVIGNVVVEAGANIWFGAVLRGDQNVIRIGERASIQDNAVLHCNEPNATIIGRDVIVGHGAVMEGCRLEDFAYVGMNAVVLDGCVMEEGALLAAGGVLKDGDRIPAWTLAAGVPAKPRKRLEGAILEEVRGGGSRVYQKLMKLYEDLGVPLSGESGSS
jgi:carbonic anhydrase/acetyltransferase-like protein (isoleucine patch superfamily)